MKSAILLLALSAIVFSSCTTAYKSGQTPDDVYYSPARPQEEYVQREERNDRRYRYSDDYYEDRYLRMKVQNRNRWSDLDDWYISERRYRYTVFTGYNLYSNPWTPQTYWNSYYNPYYNHCYTYTGNVKTVAYTKPRTFNLNTYTTVSNNQRSSNSKFRPYNSTESRNSNSNSGNFLRNIFNGNNSSSGSKVNTSSSSGNSGSSGSSSGSSGSSAPVRKF